MSEVRACPLAGKVADRMRAARRALVETWLERIADRVTLDWNDVFPTDELLDHVPLLIEGIADYVEDPADEITADVSVVAKAMELGELRHAQGFDAHQILKEYEILGGVLFDFMVQTADRLEGECPGGELLVCGHRVFRSIAVIQQHTTAHFLRLAEEKVREREEQLESFNRTVSHELKNRIAAARGASDLLREDWVDTDAAQRRKFADMVGKNLDTIQGMLADLIELSRAKLEGTLAQGRNVLLPDAAAEAKGQLREFTEERGVIVELAEDLPTVEVPAAVTELALTNFISNAVKYRNQSAANPWVRVEGEVRMEGDACEVIVRVRDNGSGVPPEAREKLFERFFRVHETVTGEEGSGLGLSIVRETLDPIGGRAWAEFPEEGSVFAFAVPCIQAKDEGGRSAGTRDDRKRQPLPRPGDTRSSESDEEWLDLDSVGSIEVTSEDSAFPIQGAMLDGRGEGWHAGEPGTQTIRVRFDEPRRLRRIGLEFVETAAERTQEFVLRWSADGDSFQEVIRQQWNFGPEGSTHEVEEYQVDLAGVTALELRIRPDMRNDGATASLRRFRLA